MLSKEQLLRMNLWQTKSKRFRINFIDDLNLPHNFRILINRLKKFCLGFLVLNLTLKNVF
jgi:hypothetical protein